MKLEKFVVGFLILTALAGCGKSKPEKPVVLNAVPTVTNEMPALTMTQTDNSQVFFKDLKGKTLIVFFNPDCDHCQREAKLMAENMDLFEGYEVFFITAEHLPVVSKFQEDYKLHAPNIHFGRAEGYDVINAVGPINEVPTLFAYDNQRLKGRLEGEVGLDRLREFLK
jgi:thiol-disulfide isomerase/thioredoxin